MRDAEGYGEEPVFVRDVTEEVLSSERGLMYRFTSKVYDWLNIDSLVAPHFSDKESVYEVNVWDGSGPISGHGRRYVVETTDGEILGDGPSPSSSYTHWRLFSSVEGAVEETVQELVDSLFDGEPPYDVPDAEELLS